MERFVFPGVIGQQAHLHHFGGIAQPPQQRGSLPQLPTTYLATTGLVLTQRLGRWRGREPHKDLWT